jgi:hypothetical protein
VNAADRAAEALLRFAARRWPDDLREEQLREWQAEIAELRRESALGQLRYALSLACSPPVEDEGGVPQGWREQLPRLGSGLRPFFLFAFAAVFCGVLAGGVSTLGDQILEMVRGYSASAGRFFRPAGIDWATHLVQLGALVVAGLFAVLIGRWLGRRLSFGWAHGTRLGAAGSAVVAPFGILLGVAAMAAVRVFPEGAYNLPLEVPAAAVFAVGMALLARRAVRLRSAGRTLTARLTAAGGSILLLDLVGFVAGLRPAAENGIPLWTGPIWFPLSLLDPYGMGFEFGAREQGWVASQSVVGAVSSSTRLLVVVCALLWAYNRFVVVVPETAPIREQEAPRTARLGAGVALVALLTWSYAAAVLASAVTAEMDPPGEFHIWAQEVRLAAIVAALLGLSLTLAGRGAVVIPGLLAGAGMIAVDSLVDRRDLSGPTVGVAVFLMGAAILLTAFAVGRFLGGGSARRTAAGVAVVGALTGPVLVIQAPDGDVPLPRGFAVATAIDVVLLVVAACGAAFAISSRPRWVAYAVTGVLAGGLGTLGLLTLSGQFLVKAGVLAQLPVAAVLLLVMGWPRQSWWRWTLLFTGAVVLAVPMVYLDVAVSIAFADVLFGAAGFGFPADGIPFFSGAAVVALALAGLFSALVAPAHRAAPALEPKLG